MKAELLLSRPSYRAGHPVVGSVRIHHDNISATSSSHRGIAVGRSRPEQTTTNLPIREAIVSARLYLAGRAHLGSSARDKSSRWRSSQEVKQLKHIYGECHPCLSTAMAEEKSRWKEWNGEGGKECMAGDGSIDDEKDAATRGNNVNPPRNTSFCQSIPLPQVTHIEQGERIAVHSCLNHSVVISSDQSETPTAPTVGNQQSNNFSHLPPPHENNVVCLWMTNILELLDLPERHLDRKCICAKEEYCQCGLRPGRGKFHGDMHPYRPLQVPDLNVVNEIWKEMETTISEKLHSVQMSDDESTNASLDSSGIDEEVHSSKHPQSAWERIVESANSHSSPFMATETSSADYMEDHHQLAFSFRADLPPDIPPTMYAECVKYFYSTVLVVTTVEGKILVAHCPFLVHTSDSHSYPNRQQSHSISTTRVHIGNLCAIAHSVALPTYITSNEASNANSSQLTVIANPPACDIVSRRTAEERTSTHRIEDENGGLCAMMTLVGIGGHLTQGTRLGIRICFPRVHDETGDGAGVIPCHRVCCALVGEEYAVHEFSGGDNPPKRKKRARTRTCVLDSAYENVEFGYTEAISMGLVLPLNCPVTVKNDMVEVVVVLKVEFTVGRSFINSSDAGAESDQVYRIIRLDLPCEVVHGNEVSGSDFRDGNAEGEQENMHSTSIGMQKFWKRSHERHVEGVDAVDVQPELNILSVQMLESYLHRMVL